MKKLTLKKLTVQRETLRAISAIELTRIAGGAVSPTETCAANCPLVAVTGAPVGAALEITMPPRG